MYVLERYIDKDYYYYYCYYYYYILPIRYKLTDKSFTVDGMDPIDPSRMM